MKSKSAAAAVGKLVIELVSCLYSLNNSRRQPLLEIVGPPSASQAGPFAHLASRAVSDVAGSYTVAFVRAIPKDGSTAHPTTPEPPASRSR